jgi:hypothetical protein
MATMARLTLKGLTANYPATGTMRGWRRASGYFYFKGGEATNWIDRTVPVSNLGA